jgi:pilus assembly protein Flp/PilA
MRTPPRAAFKRNSESGNAPRKEVMAAVLTKLTSLASSFVFDDEDGQGLAEYALILALIAIVAILALIFLGSQISDKLSIIGDEL